MIARIELRSWLCAALALAAGAALAPLPAWAQGSGKAPEGGPRVVVRGYYLLDSFSHSEAALGVDTFTTETYRGKPGGGVDAEYLLTPWLGIDLAASQTHIEADRVTTTPVGPAFETKGKIQVRPSLLGLYGHFYRLEHAAIYLGPLVGVVQPSGSRFRGPGPGLGWGAAPGRVLPLGSSGRPTRALGRAIASGFPAQPRNPSHTRDTFLFGGGLSSRG